MPPKPPTACRTAICGGYAVERGLCKDCLPVTSPAPETPTPQSKHDYHRQWKKLYDTSRWRYTVQPAVLRRDPICKKCNHNASMVVDHVKDHRGDVKLFFDLNNLRGVCKDCHDEKTGTQHGFKRDQNLPPTPTAITEPGTVPADVDFIALLNLDRKKRTE